MTKSAVKASKGKNSDRLPAWRFIFTELVALIRQFGSTVVWSCVVLYLIRETAETVQAFAGRTSVANVIVDLAARLNATVAMSVSLAGVTSLLLALEHRRHKKTRQRLTGRITQLELIIDPNRSSSQLTTEGTTPIGDL